MSKEINHWCVVCGKGYHACDSCNETKSFTPWRALTDSIEHFKIFTVLKDFNNKLISKKEARELFNFQPGNEILVLGDKKRGIAILPKAKQKEHIKHIFGDIEA